MADTFPHSLIKFTKKWVKLNALDIKEKSNGVSENKNFKRKEKWVTFNIIHDKLDLDIAMIDADLNNIFTFLLSIMTSDCAPNDLISIYLASDYTSIYLPPRPKNLYTAQSITQLIDDKNEPIIGTELKFTVITVQAPTR